MNRKIFAALLAGLPALGFCADPLADIRDDADKAGGVYYAYPVVADSMAPAPAGYEPVYISHYGRHGSRWMLNESVYKVTRKVLAKQKEDDNLTELGLSLIPQVEKGASHTEGHYGELSRLGESQHRGIAERMYRRFPGLLRKNGNVEARSSQVPRCIMSMAAFTEQLRDCEPSLTVYRHTTPSDMEILVPETPEAKELGKDDSKWRRKFKEQRDALTTSPATAGKIFKDPSKVGNLPEFMRYLNDIGISVQDVDGLDIDVLSVFTPEDNADHWKSANYIMYVRHALSSVGDSAGAKAAKPLLHDFVERADKGLAGEISPVDLRFGHDSSLIRLISLMGISPDEPAPIVPDNTPDAVAPYWQTYRITPMAANLQLVFLRNGSGDVLVAPRYNEQPAYISGLKSIPGYPVYYKWSEVRNLWNNRL